MSKFPSLKDAICSGVENQPPSRWPTFDGNQLDRSAFVTSSEVGYCERKVWYDKQSVDPTPTAVAGALPPTGDVMWGYFERGHNVEAWAVAQLRRTDSELEFEYLGTDQVSFYDGNQSGTPDGMMRDGYGRAYTVEIKSIDPRTNIKNLPKKTHIDQTLQNMELMEHCLSVKIAGGKLIYVNASNYMEMHEYDVEWDFDRLHILQAKAENIMAAQSADDLLPEGMYKSGGCMYCDHTDACSDRVAATQAEKGATKLSKAKSKGLFK